MRLSPSRSFGTERMPRGSACWGMRIESTDAMMSLVTPNRPAALSIMQKS